MPNQTASQPAIKCDAGQDNMINTLTRLNKSPMHPSDNSNRMKIAFINRRPMEGHYSLESYFKRIGETLKTLGHNVKTHTSPYASKGLISRLKIIRFAHQHQTEINHITGDIHFAALGTDPARTVITVADCGRLHQLSGIKREILRQLWYRKPLLRVAAVTVISQAVKEDLLSWLPALDPARVHVVPVSISPLFTFSAKPFDHTNPRILQVGTTPNKNIPRLIEAMQGINATLVVIGRLDENLQKFLAHHNIRHENHIGINEQAVVNIYRSVDLVSFASTLEGFGMPILEAQAIGRPVLTSNCTSMPDVAGKGALLVDPFSVASIRAGLIRLIEDEPLRNTLIKHGLANIHRFSSDAIAAQYLSIYQELLPNPGQP